MGENEYKWVTQYAEPCFRPGRDRLEQLPHIKIIKEFLDGDNSRGKVLDYFMIPHNMRTLKLKNYSHLLIPYVVKDIGKRVTGIVHEPFYDELPVPLSTISFENKEIGIAREKGIIKELSIEDILLVHFLKIVDTCKKEELRKYEYLYVKPKNLLKLPKKRE